MCQKCVVANDHCNSNHPIPIEQDKQKDPTKRKFINRTSAALLSLLATGLADASETKAIKQSKSKRIISKPENELTPDQALERLMQGNERYVSGNSEPLDFHDVEISLAQGQNPYATILGCSDSRVSPEHCFDEALGDLFIARVAGNYLTNDNLATIEYSVAVLNTPLVMVLGHESCGAVKAAIDAVDYNHNFPGHIQLLASAIAPAVRKVSNTMENRLIQVTRQNVIMTVERLRDKTPILDYYYDRKKLKIVGGIYHLDTGRVELIA